MRAKALEGVRVVEFGPLVALPLTGRTLASLGAEVIRLETNHSLDEMCFIPNWARGAGQPEYQLGKKRITLDVRTPKGKEILFRLLKMADVFMTNFRKEVLVRWGIDFPQVREVNPDIIIMWQTGFGSQGPYANYKSMGLQMQHTAGISMMTGFPGSSPTAVNTSYADYYCGVFQPLAVIAALERRRRTGKPTIIESSIYKSGVVTAGPAILDFQANGRLPEAHGNRDPHASPHGVYPCKGEDRYCAIAAFTDEQWKALCQVMDKAQLARDHRFTTLVDRIRNADDLDVLVSEWTLNQTAEDVMKRLQEAGVPAGIVSKGQDLYESAHLRERNFYRGTRFYVSDRSKLGMDWDLGPPAVAWSIPMRLSETPCDFGSYKRIGEDNEYVYGQLLQMSTAEIEELTKEGILV